MVEDCISFSEDGNCGRKNQKYKNNNNNNEKKRLKRKRT